MNIGYPKKWIVTVETSCFLLDCEGAAALDKPRYLSEEESARCRMAADAFTELYELDDIAVVNAGRFGFVKFRYYTPDSGFDNIVNCTDSRGINRKFPIRC